LFDYWTGLGIAFLLWLFHAARLLALLNSQLNRNLNKIGRRISYMSQASVPMDWSEAHASWWSKAGKFMLVVGLGLPFVFASWLYVAYIVSIALWGIYTNASAPQAIREVRWKMKHMDLSFDQLVRESIKVTDEDPSNFEKHKQAVIESMRENGLEPS